MEAGIVNRLRFFSEMKKGFLDTVKAVSKPLIEEKMEQFDRAADSLLQIKWISLSDDITLSGRVIQQYVDGTPVIIFHANEEIQAASTICPVCTNLFYFSESTLQLKCFSCEKSYSLVKGEGDLHVQFLPLRKRNNRYEIGIEDSNKHKL